MKTCRMLISLFLSAVLVSEAASTPAIGVVMAQGNIQIDHKNSPGNATLFDGALIETASSPSALLLKDNLRIDLEQSTAGVVHNDRLVLQSGTARANVRQDYAVETENLILKPADGWATSVIRRSPSSVTMTVEQGQMRVESRDGILLARVNAGESVELQQSQQPGTATANGPTRVELTGKLEKQGDLYFLTDRASGITQQLTGVVPAAAVGKVVTVSGVVLSSRSAVAPAERVVEIQNSRPKGSGFPCFGSVNCEKAWIGTAVVTATGVTIGILLLRESDRVSR